MNTQGELTEFQSKPLEELIEWETNTLTEMVLVKNKSKIFLVDSILLYLFD